MRGRALLAPEPPSLCKSPLPPVRSSPSVEVRCAAVKCTMIRRCSRALRTVASVCAAESSCLRCACRFTARCAQGKPSKLSRCAAAVDERCGSANARPRVHVSSATSTRCLRWLAQLPNWSSLEGQGHGAAVETAPSARRRVHGDPRTRSVTRKSA